jgi:hypothetical protein
MATRARGPLIEDYWRAIKAARRAGAKAVRIERGGTAVVIPLDDAYLDKLAQGQPPEPSSKDEGEVHNWKNW